uniref:Uncharacterized protein n=1 Tax=Solanum lycopersicum TaxID=4081 RepID=A0A3Q7EX31_SOLLC
MHHHFSTSSPPACLTDSVRSKNCHSKDKLSSLLLHCSLVASIIATIRCWICLNVPLAGGIALELQSFFFCLDN